MSAFICAHTHTHIVIIICQGFGDQEETLETCDGVVRRVFLEVFKGFVLFLKGGEVLK